MKKSLLAFALAFPFLANSQTYNYMPNTLNVPCLAEKGDATLSLGWGRGEFSQSLEIQSVYSVARHLAVMANYFGAREKAVRSQVETGTDYYLMEVAVGAYEKLPKGSASLFVGFGAGNLFSNYNLDRTAEFGVQRWFLQPGMTYRSRYFQAALALRLSRLNYSRGEVDFSIEPTDLHYILNVEKNAPLFLPEVGFQAGMRFKPVTVSLGICSIFPNTNNVNFARLNTSLSVAVDIGVGKKKKSSTEN